MQSKTLFKTLLLLTLFFCARSAYSQTSKTGRVEVAPAAVRPSSCSSGDQFNPNNISGTVYLCGPDDTWSAVGTGGPSLSGDNTFTNNNRFKGPIPYQDVTAYMPDGGCDDSTDNGSPPAIGTISSSSANLSVSAGTWKNGCGLAMMHAGATSALATPPVSCTISSIAVVGSVATVTCSSAHGFPAGYVPFGSQGAGIVISGVTNASFNGTYEMASAPTTATLTYPLALADTTSSGGTATFFWGYAHGSTGSTTWNYKITACDRLQGCSASTSAGAITNGVSTLVSSHDGINYNWLELPFIANTYSYGIYRDDGAGGAYTCIGVAYTHGYVDYGNNLPCPPYLPATPPSSATAQTLFTTITSGAPGTALVLATTASNTATTQYVYHDESSFVKSCVTDLIAYQSVLFGAGSTGCYLPYGVWPINGDIGTTSLATNEGGADGVRLIVAGHMWFQTQPLIITKSNWYIEGVGQSAGSSVFSYNPMTYVQTTSLPAAIVVMGSTGTTINNFMFSNLSGNGIITGSLGTGQPGITSLNLNRNSIRISTGNHAGEPLILDTNVLGVWADGLSLIGNPNTNTSILHMTSTEYSGNMQCCIYISNLTSYVHGIKIDAPGGSVGGAQLWSLNGWTSESMSDTGVFTLDSQVAPGSLGERTTFLIGNMTINADTSVFYVFNLINGSTWAAVGEVDFTSGAAPAAGSWSICTGNATACDIGTLPNFFHSAVGGPGLTGVQGSGMDINPKGTTVAYFSEPILGTLPYGSISDTPLPTYAQLLPPPDQFIITGTGSGSLSAATYYMKVSCIDVKGGQSFPGSEQHQTVGASGKISVSWNDAMHTGCSNYRFFYGTSAGGEANYFTVVGNTNPFGSSITYDFTTTAGSTSGAPITGTTLPSAYYSWLRMGFNSSNCLLCAAAGSDWFPLGIGVEPTPGNSVKLHVGGGSVRADKWYEAKEVVAPTCVANYDLLWGDSTAHRLKVCNNNGTATTLAQFTDKLSVFAATTSSELAGVISDETGSGSLVFANTPTLVTPVLGAATGTSLNLGATGVLSTTAQSGTGSICMTTSCAMTTPSLGAATATSLNIGTGTTVTKILSATATLDFGSLVSIGCEDLTITVTGAALGDTTAIGVPNGSVPSTTFTFSSWVSSADTVTIRGCALVSGDPASGTFRATVTKF